MSTAIENEEPNFRNTMDAKLWAEAFMRRFEHRKDEIDEGLMLTWFANAIMAGYDHARRQP